MGGVAKAVKKAVDKVVDVVKDVVKTVKKVVQDAIKFVTTVVKNVVEIIKTGNVLDLIIVAGLAVTQQWASLAKYATIRVGIPALTSAAAEMGWISSEIAMIINIGAALAVAYQSWANPGEFLGLTDTAGGISSTITSMLEGMGVSPATALTTANTVQNIAAYVGIGQQVYGIYDTIQQVKALQEQYAQALAEFEAWKADFERAKAVSEGNHQEAMDFATGQYYKKLPGQDLYHVFMPGREAYVCMEAVAPAYWVENRQSPFTTEREIVSMTWDQWLPIEDRFELKAY